MYRVTTGRAWGGTPIWPGHPSGLDLPMDATEMTEKAQAWQENAEHLAGQAKKWQETLSGTARKTGRVMDEYVHENAWVSVALAATLGCVLGVLLSRGRD